ncbi:MAG: sensor histidine kinase [Planctomycetota bacterium]
MRTRPILLLLAIVVLPVVLMTWAAQRLAAREAEAVQQRFRQVMEGRLQDANAGIEAHFDRLGSDLRRLTAIDDFRVDALRDVVRSEPALLQLFVLSPDGDLQYPNPADALNATEQSFLLRTATMFTGGDLQNAVSLTEDRSKGDVEATLSDGSRSNDQPVTTKKLTFNPVQKSADPDQSSASSGWFVWYWERGLNLIFWQRRPTGHIVGAALERARWMSDLLSELPETRSSDEEQDSITSSQIRLVNSSAASMYRWGRFETEASSEPLCEVAVSAPLASWRLQCFVPDEQFAMGIRQSAYVGLAGGLLAVAVAVAACAVLLWRDYSRDMRQASQQVSFVNQVSHELKTPLTNIRMYAELLERDLDAYDDETAGRSRQRLDVILGEGQRLSRLIGNVLTFARQQRRTLESQPTELVVDDVLQRTLERFRPSLEELQIEVSTDLSAADQVRVDADFLEQIVGNLISNVEKYAASGKSLRISSRIEHSMVTIEVADAGPGISPADRDRMFAPFIRGSNEINAAAGTGIGLSIARELARLHGGDLTLEESASGCIFRVALQCGG